MVVMIIALKMKFKNRREENKREVKIGHMYDTIRFNI